MLAQAHLRRREFAEAEALLRQALSHQGNSFRASALCVSLAFVLVEMRCYDEGAKALDAAAELGGGEDRPTLAEARAYWCLRQGIEPARALAAADIAIRAGTDRAAILRAWALAENGRIDDAREQLKAWTPDAQTQPQRAECAYLAGRALAACGDASAAAEQFRRAIEAEPDGLFGHLSREATGA